MCGGKDMTHCVNLQLIILISLNFASFPVSRHHVVFTLLQVCVCKMKCVVAGFPLPSAGVCVLRWAEEVGWRFSQGNAPLKKASLPPASFSLVRAAICMYVTDAQTQTVEGLPNSHSTSFLFQLSLCCVSFQPPRSLCRISFVWKYMNRFTLYFSAFSLLEQLVLWTRPFFVLFCFNLHSRGWDIHISHSQGVSSLLSVSRAADLPAPQLHQG